MTEVTKQVIFYTVLSHVILILAVFALWDQNDIIENNQAHTINVLYDENDRLKTELEKYKATEQELIDLGASSEQAQTIIRASEALNVSPKSLEL